MFLHLHASIDNQRPILHSFLEFSREFKGLAVGADAYVTKPFSTRELVEKVQTLLDE